jgi:hypothetical protein
MTENVRIVECCFGLGSFVSSGWICVGTGAIGEQVTMRVEHCNVWDSTTSNGPGVLSGYGPKWYAEYYSFVNCSSSPLNQVNGVWISVRPNVDSGHELAMNG